MGVIFALVLSPAGRGLGEGVRRRYARNLWCWPISAHNNTSRLDHFILHESRILIHSYVLLTNMDHIIKKYITLDTCENCIQDVLAAINMV